MDALAYDTSSSGVQPLAERPDAADAAGQFASLDPVARLAERCLELEAQLRALDIVDDDTARPRFSNHLAEDAQDQQQRQGEAAVRLMVHADLQQVQHALAHASSGRYGLCEDCGRQIPPRRLEILPAATLCVACQGRREARQVRH
jgi:DnaK suppressor protein